MTSCFLFRLIGKLDPERYERRWSYEKNNKGKYHDRIRRYRPGKNGITARTVKKRMVVGDRFDAHFYFPANGTLVTFTVMTCFFGDTKIRNKNRGSQSKTDKKSCPFFISHGCLLLLYP